MSVRVQGNSRFDYLRTVTIEKKKHRFDLLANHSCYLHGYKSRIIPYVMTWNGIVAIYLKQIGKMLGFTAEWSIYTDKIH